jgi:hypothetical protein
VKKKKLSTVFPTDQSEAELLYLYSLFLSVKKPFQKTKLLIILYCDADDATLPGIYRTQKIAKHNTCMTVQRVSSRRRKIEIVCEILSPESNLLDEKIYV